MGEKEVIGPIGSFSNTSTSIINQELILNIIKNFKEPVLAIDLNGKVLFWNKASEELFGYKEEEVLGMLYPLVKNEHGFELETILNKTKENESLVFRTQKQDKNGNPLDLILSTNPLHHEGNLIGVSIEVQQIALLKKVNYLSLDIQSEAREQKRTFDVIRDLILTTLGDNQKTINQISNDSGINWRTVEKHLTYLIGKKLIAEIFSSEYVRIFELTEYGKETLEDIKKENYDKITGNSAI